MLGKLIPHSNQLSVGWYIYVHSLSHGFTLQHLGQCNTRTFIPKNTIHTRPLLLSMLKKIAKTNIRTPTPSTHLPRGARQLMSSLIIDHVLPSKCRPIYNSTSCASHSHKSRHAYFIAQNMWPLTNKPSRYCTCAWRITLGINGTHNKHPKLVHFLQVWHAFHKSIFLGVICQVFFYHEFAKVVAPPWSCQGLSRGHEINVTVKTIGWVIF